jgi:hypothetical protein
LLDLPKGCKYSSVAKRLEKIHEIGLLLDERQKRQVDVLLGVDRLQRVHVQIKRVEKVLFAQKVAYYVVDFFDCLWLQIRLT